MPSQIPQKDPKAVADLVQRAKEARERLPLIVQQIEDLVRQVDPIELLSQLTLLFQTHPVNEQPNRDESNGRQVADLFQPDKQLLCTPENDHRLVSLQYDIAGTRSRARRPARS
jgi:hypothetical protein